MLKVRLFTVQEYNVTNRLIFITNRSTKIILKIGCGLWGATDLKYVYLKRNSRHIIVNQLLFNDYLICFFRRHFVGDSTARVWYQEVLSAKQAANYHICCNSSAQGV